MAETCDSSGLSLIDTMKSPEIRASSLLHNTDMKDLNGDINTPCQHSHQDSEKPTTPKTGIVDPGLLKTTLDTNKLSLLRSLSHDSEYSLDSYALDNSTFDVEQLLEEVGFAGSADPTIPDRFIPSLIHRISNLPDNAMKSLDLRVLQSIGSFKRKEGRRRLFRNLSMGRNASQMGVCNGCNLMDSHRLRCDGVPLLRSLTGPAAFSDEKLPRVEPEDKSNIRIQCVASFNPSIANGARNSNNALEDGAFANISKIQSSKTDFQVPIIVCSTDNAFVASETVCDHISSDNKDTEMPLDSKISRTSSEEELSLISFSETTFEDCNTEMTEIPTASYYSLSHDKAAENEFSNNIEIPCAENEFGNSNKSCNFQKTSIQPEVVATKLALYPVEWGESTNEETVRENLVCNRDSVVSSVLNNFLQEVSEIQVMTSHLCQNVETYNEPIRNVEKQCEVEYGDSDLDAIEGRLGTPVPNDAQHGISQMMSEKRNTKDFNNSYFPCDSNTYKHLLQMNEVEKSVGPTLLTKKNIETSLVTGGKDDTNSELLNIRNDPSSELNSNTDLEIYHKMDLKGIIIQGKRGHTTRKSLEEISNTPCFNEIRKFWDTHNKSIKSDDTFPSKIEKEDIFKDIVEEFSKISENDHSSQGKKLTSNTATLDNECLRDEDTNITKQVLNENLTNNKVLFFNHHLMQNNETCKDTEKFKQPKAEKMSTAIPPTMFLQLHNKTLNNESTDMVAEKSIKDNQQDVFSNSAANLQCVKEDTPRRCYDNDDQFSGSKNTYRKTATTEAAFPIQSCDPNHTVNTSENQLADELTPHTYCSVQQKILPRNTFIKRSVDNQHVIYFPKCQQQCLPQRHSPKCYLYDNVNAYPRKIPTFVKKNEKTETNFEMELNLNGSLDSSVPLTAADSNSIFAESATKECQFLPNAFNSVREPIFTPRNKKYGSDVKKKYVSHRIPLFRKTSSAVPFSSPIYQRVSLATSTPDLRENTNSLVFNSTEEPEKGILFHRKSQSVPSSPLISKQFFHELNDIKKNKHDSFSHSDEQVTKAHKFASLPWINLKRNEMKNEITRTKKRSFDSIYPNVNQQNGWENFHHNLRRTVSNPPFADFQKYELTTTSFGPLPDVRFHTSGIPTNSSSVNASTILHNNTSITKNSSSYFPPKQKSSKPRDDIFPWNTDGGIISSNVDSFTPYSLPSKADSAFEQISSPNCHSFLPSTPLTMSLSPITETNSLTTRNHPRPVSSEILSGINSQTSQKFVHCTPKEFTTHFPTWSSTKGDERRTNPDKIQGKFKSPDRDLKKWENISNAERSRFYQSQYVDRTHKINGDSQRLIFSNLKQNGQVSQESPQLNTPIHLLKEEKCYFNDKKYELKPATSFRKEKRVLINKSNSNEVPKNINTLAISRFASNLCDDIFSLFTTNNLPRTILHGKDCSYTDLDKDYCSKSIAHEPFSKFRSYFALTAPSKGSWSSRTTLKDYKTSITDSVLVNTQPSLQTTINCTPLKLLFSEQHHRHNEKFPIESYTGHTQYDNNPFSFSLKSSDNHLPKKLPKSSLPKPNPKNESYFKNGAYVLSLMPEQSKRNFPKEAATAFKNHSISIANVSDSDFKSNTILETFTTCNQIDNSSRIAASFAVIKNNRKLCDNSLACVTNGSDTQHDVLGVAQSSVMSVNTVCDHQCDDKEFKSLVCDRSAMTFTSGVCITVNDYENELSLNPKLYYSAVYLEINGDETSHISSKEDGKDDEYTDENLNQLSEIADVCELQTPFQRASKDLEELQIAIQQAKATRISASRELQLLQEMLRKDEGNASEESSQNENLPSSEICRETSSVASSAQLKSIQPIFNQQVEMLLPSCSKRRTDHGEGSAAYRMKKQLHHTRKKLFEQERKSAMNVDSLQKEISTLRDRLNETEKFETDLMNRLNYLQIEISDLQEEKNKIKEALAELQQKAKKKDIEETVFWKEEIRRVQDELREECEERLSSMEEKLRSKEKQLNIVLNENEMLRDQLELRTTDFPSCDSNIIHNGFNHETENTFDKDHKILLMTAKASSPTTFKRQDCDRLQRNLRETEQRADHLNLLLNQKLIELNKLQLTLSKQTKEMVQLEQAYFQLRCHLSKGIRKSPISLSRMSSSMSPVSPRNTSSNASQQTSPELEDPS